MMVSLAFQIGPGGPAMSPVERARLLSNPGFGQLFTDHMATIRWSEGIGWHDAKVERRRAFAIDPACAVLHYAQQIFEGLKAYRSDDGDIILFRPEENARRFNSSADRLAMPGIPEELFIGSIEALIGVDWDWVPGGDASLYLRPFMFASEALLGVRPSREYIFCVIASPVGSYFSDHSAVLTLWVADRLSRAGPGGTGAAKCGGNYGASLRAQAEAHEHGCDQVIFLDACEHRWVEELGGMNIFFAFDDGTIRTPPLSDTILAGITRSSIIELMNRRGIEVREESYAIDQWKADAASGHLREAFACGTAAIIAPVGTIRSAADEWTIDEGECGPVTRELREELIAIQRGRIDAPADWIRRIAPEPAPQPASV
jgi:branched-chain amino acid aminotransferase